MVVLNLFLLLIEVNTVDVFEKQLLSAKTKHGALLLDTEIAQTTTVRIST